MMLIYGKQEIIDGMDTHATLQTLDSKRIAFLSFFVSAMKS